MSLGSRIVIAFVTILSGLIFVIGAVAFDVPNKPVWCALAVFCLLISVSCFQGRHTAVTYRIVGGMVLACYIAYLVDEIRSGNWTSASRATPSALNALIGLAIFGLPAGYVVIFGRLNIDLFSKQEPVDIYKDCPVYTTDHFVLRLVELDDAEDLLKCYSDRYAVALMNSDNCNTDFYFQTIDEMKQCIEGWLEAYRNRVFVRFSIYDIENDRVVGTIEMYESTQELGILRVDLCQDYEQRVCLDELMPYAVDIFYFYGLFDVGEIAMKAIPAAGERIAVLLDMKFEPAQREINGHFGDYYVYSH